MRARYVSNDSHAWRPPGGMSGAVRVRARTRAATRHAAIGSPAARGTIASADGDGATSTSRKHVRQRCVLEPRQLLVFSPPHPSFP